MAGQSQPAVLASARKRAPGFCGGDAAVGGSQAAVGVAELERQPEPFTGRSGDVGTPCVLAKVVGHGSHEGIISFARDAASRRLAALEVWSWR